MSRLGHSLLSPDFWPISRENDRQKHDCNLGAPMLQNKQIVLSTLGGYLDYLKQTQPELSTEAAYQIAAILTQAEFSLQSAEAMRR